LRVCLQPAFAGTRNRSKGVAVMVRMYRVYSIIERPKQEDRWDPVGVAFPQEDGKGFNIMLANWCCVNTIRRSARMSRLLRDPPEAP
jgi:hypothetical protein